MQITLDFQGLNDPPKLANLQQPIADFTDIEHMRFVVVEAGMASKEPSVIISVSDDQCSVCLQTSLDKLVAAATGLMGIAEREWNWKQPEGSATLMPMAKADRKKLLEALKKELDEWDDLDEQMGG